MRETTPRVYLIGRPSIDWVELDRYLRDYGGTDWFDRITGEGMEPEGQRLVEFMGRLCYRSFAPGLNPNVTKIRTDSDAYLLNLLKSLHGSVLEHACYSFVFADVSRTLTHELVRHRAGTAISQESLRYVRVTDLPFEHPAFVRDDPSLLAAADKLLFALEMFQQVAAKETGIDAEGVDFHVKKTITSAARRYLPEGLATTVGWSANLRTLRHVIAARTDPGAEEEIRRVFDQVGQIMLDECPGIFCDFTRTDDGTWVPQYPKV